MGSLRYLQHSKAARASMFYMATNAITRASDNSGAKFATNQHHVIGLCFLASCLIIPALNTDLDESILTDTFEESINIERYILEKNQQIYFGTESLPTDTFEERINIKRYI